MLFIGMEMLKYTWLASLRSKEVVIEEVPKAICSWFVDNVQKGECSLKGFLFVVGESIDEWESRKFNEGLDSLSLYRTFCKALEFKAYLHGACDAGSSLDEELMDELGRLRGREGRKECLLCDDECCVLQDCPIYSTLRNDFMCKFQELLGI